MPICYESFVQGMLIGGEILSGSKRPNECDKDLDPKLPTAKYRTL
jgi:hypothetical protein